MRMKLLGTLTAFTCVGAVTVISAQDSTSAAPAPPSASKPPYTAEAMLRRVQGQSGLSVELSPNAALGYWMAFAQMKEIPVGASARDTDALLQANAEALATLARATRLPYCEWGIEYALGSRAPVAHLPKARALARVNSAAAVRAMARGMTDEAVEHWLVGMRFALHIERGGTLISTLSAWSALRDTWSSIEPLLTGKRLTAVQRNSLAEAVQMLPETVFNWSRAVLNEARVLQTQAGLTPRGLSFTPPGDTDTKRFLREIERVSIDLARSPELAGPAIAAFDNDTRKELNAFYRDSMPSLTKVNETRREVKAAREKMLALLK